MFPFAEVSQWCEKRNSDDDDKVNKNCIILGKWNFICTANWVGIFINSATCRKNKTIYHFTAVRGGCRGGRITVTHLFLQGYSYILKWINAYNTIIWPPIYKSRYKYNTTEQLSGYKNSNSWFLKYVSRWKWNC